MKGPNTAVVAGFVTAALTTRAPNAFAVTVVAGGHGSPVGPVLIWRSNIGRVFVSSRDVQTTVHRLRKLLRMSPGECSHAA